MGVTSNCERSVTAEEAVAYLLDYAANAGFQATYETKGLLNKTTTCFLSAPAGRAFIGRGKGIAAQSIASAIAESFEHYYHNAEVLRAEATTPWFSFREDPDLCGSSPDFGLIFSESPVPLQSIKFDSLCADWKAIFYPAVLMNAHYIASSDIEERAIAQSKIYRYATNSGTAAGLTKDEAILHGLMEIVERDAIGLAFVTHVLSRPAAPIRKVRQDTLPLPCRQLINEIIEETQGELAVFDITSDIGIPTALCSLTIGAPARHRFFGSGSSLSAEYAMERALLEALQGFHIQFLFDHPHQSPIDRDVTKMSLYQKCQLSSGYFEYQGGELNISFQDIAVMPAYEDNVSSQVDIATKMLARAGIKSYSRVIFENGIFVTQVLSPKMERLYLINHGIPVAAGDRGRSARHI